MCNVKVIHCACYYSEQPLEHEIAASCSDPHDPEHCFIRQFYNSTMHDPDQSLPETPLGVDPDVQSRIDALFAQPPMTDSTKREVEHTKNTDAIVPCSDAVTASPQDTAHVQSRSRKPGPLGETSESIEEATESEDEDEGTWQERAIWAPLSPSYLNLAIGFSDPLVDNPSPPPTQDTTPNGSALTPTTSSPFPSFSLSALLNYAITYFSSCIDSYFSSSSSTPDIFEYTDREIRQNTHVDIEVQEIQLPSSATVVRVTAVVTDSFGASREGDEQYESTEWRIELRAKPKRVREIMRRRGCYITEEVFEEQIRYSFRGLKDL